MHAWKDLLKISCISIATYVQCRISPWFLKEGSTVLAQEHRCTQALNADNADDVKT